MIITRLWGGLGNQMFQYAFGYAKARQAGVDLVLDTRFFHDEFIRKNPRFTKQKLNLFQFPIDYKERINDTGELIIINYLQKHRVNQILRIPYLTVIPIGSGIKYVKETRMKFQPILKSMQTDNRYYDGYWQTEKYFYEYRNDLIRQYSYVSNQANSFINKYGVDKPEAVAVHLRMGDYGKKRFMAHYNYVINPEYYKLAVKEVKKRLNNPIFFVCSNNIQKAKEILGEANEFIYVSEMDEMNDLDEFVVMTKCTNHIISNSTFSWWTAWLGAQDRSINIAPNIVFGNKDIIPANWIRINVPQ